MESHLLQMRGLKPSTSSTSLTYKPMSHLLQMRGLKHSREILAKLGYSRIFYRCVD